MHRFAVLVAAGICLSGISPADAAARHKKVRAVPSLAQAPVAQAVAANGLGCAATMLTDGGYGRFLPCDLGDGL